MAVLGVPMIGGYGQNALEMGGTETPNDFDVDR